MKTGLKLAAILLLLSLVPGCAAPPEKGFSSLTLDQARQPFAGNAAETRTCVWPTLNLVLVENGPVVASLENVRLTLGPDPAAPGGGSLKAVWTATLHPRGYCTSATWNDGVGQVLQLFLEKDDNSLLVPWTLGALHVPSGSASQALSFERSLPSFSVAAAAKAEVVMKTCLWTKCP
jgi:hypothetical protein